MKLIPSTNHRAVPRIFFKIWAKRTILKMYAQGVHSLIRLVVWYFCSYNLDFYGENVLAMWHEYILYLCSGALVICQRIHYVCVYVCTRGHCRTLARCLHWQQTQSTSYHNRTPLVRRLIIRRKISSKLLR